MKNIVLAALLILSSPAPSAETAITKVEAQQHTADILNVFKAHYVYPDKAAEIVAAMDRSKHLNTSSLEELISLLQTDLRIRSNDGHLSLHLASESADRTSQRRPLSEQDRVVSTQTLRHNDNKVGLLKFNRFIGSDDFQRDLQNAMLALSKFENLIIDLRENRGGSPATVAFLSSFLVDPNTPLWKVINRSGDSVIETQSTEKPFQFSGGVCILISKKTYSAAEAFTYTLKHLGRSCVVGEPSGGGAHLVEMVQINDELDFRLSTARAHNDITDNNWEAVGVQPTITVSPDKAIDAALKHFANQP